MQAFPDVRRCYQEHATGCRKAASFFACESSKGTRLYAPHRFTLLGAQG